MRPDVLGELARDLDVGQHLGVAEEALTSRFRSHHTQIVGLGHVADIDEAKVQIGDSRVLTAQEHPHDIQ